MDPVYDHLAGLISAFGERVHREIHEGFAGLNKRFDRIEIQLDRQTVELERWVGNIERKWKDCE